MLGHWRSALPWVALVTLCATQPEPYLEIVKFLPDGLIITFEVTVLSLL